VRGYILKNTHCNQQRARQTRPPVTSDILDTHDEVVSKTWKVHAAQYGYLRHERSGYSAFDCTDYIATAFGTLKPQIGGKCFVLRNMYLAASSCWKRYKYG
jgi:hypothetical protein